MRKENRDAEKILRELGFTFDPEKDHCEPKKTVRVFNNIYIQCESVGDKGKTLLPKDYLYVIRPYLSHMINHHRTQEEWKLHSGNIITAHKTQGRMENSFNNGN